MGKKLDTGIVVRGGVVAGSRVLVGGGVAVGSEVVVGGGLVVGSEVVVGSGLVVGSEVVVGGWAGSRFRGSCGLRYSHRFICCRGGKGAGFLSCAWWVVSPRRSS